MPLMRYALLKIEVPTYMLYDFKNHKHFEIPKCTNKVYF